MKAFLFWGLVAITLAVYAAIVGWSLPTVSAAAGGLAPFDLRAGGYSYADALQFVSALTADGKAFYLDVQQRLDLFYPALASLTLFFAFAALLPRRLAVWRYLIAATALPIAVFDYLENYAVAAMLAAGPAGLTSSLVAEASQWTLLKSASSTVVMSAALLLLVWRGALALRNRLGRPVAV